MSEPRSTQSVHWLLKATILFASVPIALCFSVATPILTKISEHFGQEPEVEYLVRMVVGILGVAMAIASPIAGAVADKIGRRPVLVTSAFLVAIAGTAPFVLDNLTAILVSRLFLGMAAAAFATVGAALVGDWFEETERARWMGLLLAASMTTGVIAAPLSGFMGDLGWRWPFLIYLMGVPLAAFAWLGLRQSPAAATPVRATADKASGGSAERRFLLSLLVVGLLAGVLMYIPAVYTPFQLRALGVENSSTVALGLTASLLLGAILAGQFGLISKRHSSRALFCWSFAVTGLGIALLALASNVQLAFAGLFVMGIGSAWLHPNLMTLAISVSEDRRGRAVGWLRSAQSIAPAIGITLFEPLVSRFGVYSALLLIAGLSALLLAGTAGRIFPFNSLPTLAHKGGANW